MTIVRGQWITTRIALLAFSTLISLVLAYWLWHQWMLFAIFVFGIYFIGGFRFLPLNTNSQKAFSVGIFLGSSIGTLSYFLK